MSATTGPTSTMPGSLHKVPAGQTCDEHPERVAKYRIQGETDSMGAEFVDACEECARRILPAARERYYPGRCDICKRFADTLRKWRDPDEGLAGPVYDACEGCVKDAQQHQLQGESLDALEDRDRVSEMIDEFDDPDPDAIDPDFDADGEDSDSARI